MKQELNFDFNKWLQSDHLEFLYRHSYPLLNADLFFHTTKNHSDVLGNHHKNFIFTSAKGELSTYHFYSELEEGTSLAKKLLDKDFFKKHFDDSMNARESLNIFLKKYSEISEKLNGLSDSELLGLFNRYWENYALVFAYFRTSNPKFVDPFVNEIVEIVDNNEYVDFYKQAAIKYLTTPFFDDPIKKELQDWLTILEKPVNEEELIAHANKYPWLFINTYSEKEALKFLIDRYDRDIDKRSDLNDQLIEFKKSSVEAKKIRDSLVRNHQLKLLSDIVIKQSHERLLVKCCWTGIDYSLKNLLNEIALRAGIDTFTLMNTYRYEDIVNLLSKKEKVLEIESADRMDSFVLISNNLDDYFISGENASVLYEKINKYSKSNTFSGSVACKGIAKGIVSIIDTKNAEKLGKQIEEFEDGNILVAGMTEPNIAPLIMRAGAVITDQGGLTSHAAIISREFEKPCIIGTKIATKILHSGDFVEVDAEKGVIKILKRFSE